VVGKPAEEDPILVFLRDDERRRKGRSGSILHDREFESSDWELV
jgi:hypothetical protein